MTPNLEHVNNLSHDGTTALADPIPPDAIDQLYDRYQNVYGQH